MLYLYREPEPNETVVIAADPSEGGDYCAAIVKSKRHLDTLMVYHQRTTSTQFGYDLLSLARYIKTKTGSNPTIAVERNMGQGTIGVLLVSNYDKLFRMPRIGFLEGDETDKIGWITNVQTRPKMLDDLSLSLTQRTNKIPHKETIHEMMSFIRNNRTGKPEAASGMHDDLVMAEAIAWQVLQYLQPEAVDNPLHFINQFPQQNLFDKYGNPTA